MSEAFENFKSKLTEFGFKLDNEEVKTVKHKIGKDMAECFSIGIDSFVDSELLYVQDYHRWIVSYSAEWMFRDESIRMEIVDLLPKTSKSKSQIIYRFT